MTASVRTLGDSRILVVDDEEGPRESLRMLLKPSYQVKTADGGRAALEDLPRYHPDLVILDIKMAGMDGLEVLRRIKEHDATIEVVMITAYASLETVKLALTHGAFEYLIKPFSRQDLNDVVRRALTRRHADLGRQSQIGKLVEEMRGLASKTRELEKTARRESAELSLRVTQLSILREISRRIVTQLDRRTLIADITDQLRTALGYDAVTITTEEPPAANEERSLVVCRIRDAEGSLGSLIADNRASGRIIDPLEYELLEMLAEYLAIALRNSSLYGQIDDTRRSLEQLITSAGEAIIAVSASDRIEGWNPAAHRIFGLSAQDAIGRPITDLFLKEDYETAKQRLAQGTSTHAFETRGLVGETSATALAVTLSALNGRHGGLDGLIAIVRDVTLQREVERQLHQSEKLRALGQLAGGIAHDFNNLLQAILGYAQLMKTNVENTELMQRSLHIVEAAAIDGSETVRRIQQFARLRPDEPFQPVDLAQVVNDAVAITRPRVEERITHENRPLDVKIDLRSVPAIHGRTAALTEMATNLILNALDAMPDGGTLTIATRTGRSRTVQMLVEDTGIGMSQDVQRRIFEPFFSTKGDGGSGLGLAMAYAIVKRHGGEIDVESTPGRGTTFTITLPTARPTKEAPVPAAAPMPRRSARVLAVDDEPQVLAALGELLENAGHTVTTVPSAAAALSQFAPGRFDVVLTNIGMPGINGWTLAERIRAADPKIGILVITGWGLREEDQLKLDALNVERCLYKPVGPAELDEAVQAAMPE